MRKFILATAVLFVAMTATAQEIVIDPSQIAASATNVAEQIDYMLDQLTELADLRGKLGDLKGYVEDVFGEDGVGGKALSVMQDLGTLDRLTESFNRTMKMAESYGAAAKEMGKLRLSDTGMMLSYLNSAKSQAEMGISLAKKILTTLGFTKKEKKDELENLIRELDESTRKLEAAMEIEMEASIMAEGLGQFMDMMDDNLSAKKYVEDTKSYGTTEKAASGTLGTVSMILVLLGLVSVVYGFRQFATGNGEDPAAELVFIRIGEALIGGMFALNVISSFFHLNL